MTENTSTQGLEESIERLVQAHISKIRVAAQAAVERAFAAGGVAKAPQGRRGSVAGTSHKQRSAPASVRRSPEELAALEERLYQVIAEKPGAAMAALGPILEVLPRELIRPMAALKAAGRVRSVGERHQTRYFPLLGDTESS